MNVKKLNQLAIYSGSIEIANWVTSTLNLTSLIIDNIYKFEKASDLADKKFSLIIVTQEKFKPLHNHLSKTGKLLPILVITNEFDGFNLPKHSKLTIDTIPLPAITIRLLEHGIKSVMQDFRLNQKLTNLAHYDPLTGAANRLLFKDRLTQTLKSAKRNKRAVSLLYFDLDDFKPVNDLYGHDVGDELLKRFVKLVSSVSRETDTIARFGGDEFVLLLPDTLKPELELMAKKIVKCLSKSQQINNLDIEIKCSIGATSIAIIGELTKASKELLESADKAVYQAKKIKGTHYIIN
ncbi:GGDEF domain-containing protein [Litorilituus sediminis]|uniref:GGDEF domain-containing protein n=1 Tax=Litorilituus sediminis TaxID=718192 RepID=A0A4V0ZFZ2_9GAMM|nr:GGDEF domain-containing protein [Litorilituus sediminis]QBG35490.1 GGDEF domain-containing protein [Litorilituus sediminis]